MDVLIGSGLIVFLAIIFLAIFLHFVPIGLWISALAANVHVGIFTLIGMRMRRVPPSKIVMPLIKANKAGLDVNVNQLEAHYLAGGNVDKVVDALIASQRAQIVLPFERSAAID
ncbi:MAG: flotillin-like FloA family protein, partial [Selenomonadaceae bacterium]|nr:flotillin-like FloA family protein [Selenomonadaceae bacterium]